MLLLGIDLGTSSIKVSVMDAETQQCLASAHYPETEASITSLQRGWAEQSPDTWWENTQKAIRKVHASKKYDSSEITAIGIAYQMHGLVVVDKKQKVLRDSIIWCDSRAVDIGNRALEEIGEEQCMSCLLNSPGNFTASKLAWVKKYEEILYKQVDKLMLPGDYLAMKLTGEITTTSSALSEGILWDFSKETISDQVMNHYGFDHDLIPEVRSLFSIHGFVKKEIAERLSLKPGIPVSYKAGDQLNNALSLNVLEPGEVAATAGTSGVIYAVTDKLFHDPYSRVNAFAHVNHNSSEKRLGVLLCINGTGIMNKWIKNTCGDELTYKQFDQQAISVAPGSEGLVILPFGNGAERMLQNKMINAHVSNIDLNLHTNAHMFRAVQEGIAFAFRYGLDIMRDGGLHPQVIRAGRANMFLSDAFVTSFVNATGVPVELYENDGSIGAALGAGIGSGIYKTYEQAFTNLKPIKKIQPSATKLYGDFYNQWKIQLQKQMN